MLEDNTIRYYRRDEIQVSSFALNHLHYVTKIGHMSSTENKHYTVDAMIYPDAFAMIYVLRGNLILNKQVINENCTVIIPYKNIEELELQNVEMYYTLIHSKELGAFLKTELQLLDVNFSIKASIFFFSLFSSIDKYQRVDEYSIASSILRLFSDMNNHFVHPKAKNKGVMIEKALNYIEEHYTEDITLKDLAHFSGYSEYYFLRTFKSIMNQTPIDYITRKRLSYVKTLLLSSDKKMTEIAHMTGFKSDVSLYKAFKKVYKITPLNYKKSYK